MARLILICKASATVLLAALLTNFSDANRQEKARGSGDYPPLWDNVPDSLDGFVTIHNKTVINPWNYLDRLGMYKILLNVTAKYMINFGPSNTGNVLWGLPLQHGWQFKTGRLADPSNVSSCGRQTGDLLCISTTSWWSCMNYYLATIPFLGAVEAGFFDEWPFEIEILPPEEHMDDFCYNTADSVTVHDCRDTIAGDYLATTEYVTMEPNKSSPNQLDVEKDVPEAQFGVSWGNAVDFIAATHFPTNFNQTNVFQVYLPQRILLSSDKAPSIPDLSKAENWAIIALDILYKGNKMTENILKDNAIEKLCGYFRSLIGFWLTTQICHYCHKVQFLIFAYETKCQEIPAADYEKHNVIHLKNTYNYGQLLNFWRRSMCSEKGREEGRYLLENGVSNPDLILPGIRKILLEFIKNHNCVTADA
ncbi:liver-enriched gene 1, tandem duplicate 1 [Mustelus asterias]